MDRGLPSTREIDGSTAQRRRLPASQRRTLILHAALRTFATSGYEGAAMEEIAAAAGVSKAVVYDHVSSKRELYQLLLESLCAELVAVVEGALQPGDGDGEALVRRATDAFFTYVEEHREGARLLLLELQSANVSQIGYELEERLTQVLAMRLGEGPLFDGSPNRELQLVLLAELVKAVVQGLAAWWFRHPDTAREELVERTVSFVWPPIAQAARA
jgi:AcrR family transcriptional regulator